MVLSFFLNDERERETNRLAGGLKRKSALHLQVKLGLVGLKSIDLFYV
jgi:hypothetical protein